MRAPQQSASTDALVLDQAITEAADAFARQPRNLAASMTRRDKRALVGDPMIDSGSGEHTALTGQIEKEVGTRLTSNHTQLPVLPFQLVRLNHSHCVITGAMTWLQNQRAIGRAPF